ncbi:uncharacterized protein UHO2_02905 [Ustilago hordei]|uniref:Uncharacterized protein n=1 Tax=Ustilago hordei TaxID=120017 RepID=I2G3F1_USTHO|nr:uncharacterized protein UHO2_02905 [Ustilago hordei]CCF53694.1 uncharacterized protein UHOR_02290 [Ustilago hordei]SYW78893.1 uncharacterized protein UHO2_02905 [Ustilago hordei]
MGGLVEKASIVKGSERTPGRVSHAERGPKFSQEEDQAQEHADQSQGRPHGQSGTIRMVTWSGRTTR